MTSPNIANITSIVGLNTFVSGISSTSANSIIVTNAASSNKVLRVNSLLASNTSSATTNLTVKLFNSATGAGSSASIVSAIAIPTGSTITVIGKDTPYYITENQSIGATCTNLNSVDITASYEEVS